MRKNFLFLGFAIPDSEMEKVFKLDNFPQVQTHKFNWNVIRGLEYQDELDFTYVSARPVTDYPLFPKKIIKRNHWKVKLNRDKIKIAEIPFINTSILKIITRFFSSIYYSFKEYHKSKEKGGVIVYSVHVPFMLTGYIISKIYNINYISIWTDPPSVINENESFLKSKLRKIELKLSKYLMSKSTKVIALTKYLAEDFAPGKPYLVIEGMVNGTDVENTKNLNKNKNSDLIKVVYTGSLSKRYGIKNIVQAVILNNKNNIVLEIYGRGDYEDELKEICDVNQNIIYNGYVSNKEILKIQAGADFLINARAAEDEYVRYSFPSKTLEYMLSGTPLITTMLPGIPEEYRNYLIVLENNDPNTISIKLGELLKHDNFKYNEIGIKAQQFALSKSYINQGGKILKFLKKETIN